MKIQHLEEEFSAREILRRLRSLEIEADFVLDTERSRRVHLAIDALRICQIQLFEKLACGPQVASRAPRISQDAGSGGSAIRYQARPAKLVATELVRNVESRCRLLGLSQVNESEIASDLKQDDLKFLRLLQTTFPRLSARDSQTDHGNALEDGMPWSAALDIAGPVLGILLWYSHARSRSKKDVAYIPDVDPLELRYPYRIRRNTRLREGEIAVDKQAVGSLETLLQFSRVRIDHRWAGQFLRHSVRLLKWNQERRVLSVGELEME